MPKKKATRVYRGPNPRGNANKAVSTGTRRKKAGRAIQSKRNSGAGWYTQGGRRQAG